MSDDDFNFIIDQEEEPKQLELVVDNTKTDLARMTPRKFGQTILQVFGELGGATWLMRQAVIDPRGFMELLKRILPRQIEMDNLDGLTVILTDQYGNSLEVSTGGERDGGGQPEAAGGNRGTAPGQRQIATGGNPTIPKVSAAKQPEVVLKEVFD